MADGAIGVDGPRGTAPAEGSSARFFRTRNALLKTVAAVNLGLLVLAVMLNFSPVVGVNLITTPFLTSWDDWLWLGSASCLLGLPLLLLLLDKPDNMATGPGLALPIVTLMLLVSLVCIAAFGPSIAAGLQLAARPGPSGQPLSPALLGLCFSILATVLIARIWNAWLFARYASAEYRARRDAVMRANAKGDSEVREVIREVAAHRREQGNAEALSAVVATLVVSLIIGLAALAGGWSADTRIGSNVGLVIAAVIFGIFAVVLMLDWLAEFPPLRALSRWINGASHYFAWLAAFYNFVDFLLVRIGSQVAGAGHNNPIARYIVLGGTQLCLCLMSWSLPDPYGLIPAFVGLTLALSVSRLWSWVEEDRNLALITQFSPNAPRRIGFKEDYRDEAIFGFMFVLALIPIAMKQADGGRLFNLIFFEQADHSDPTQWFVYFCFELAKALPLVDWADIYVAPGNFETLVPTRPWGQHATFLSRALVDLVLVAALLQAINITLRNRQQKALYAAHQINRVDEMVERVELRKALKRPRAEWFTRGFDFRHYDPDRLRELYSNTDDALRKEFIDLIFTQRGAAVGYSLQVLETLARRRASIDELRDTFRTVRLEHVAGTHRLQAMDLEGVFDELRGVEGLKNFKTELLDFAVEVGAIENTAPPTDLADLLELVIFSSRRDQFQYTRIHAAKALTRVVPRLPEPERVATLLAQLKAVRTEIFGRNQFVPEQLETALVERLREIGAPSR